MKLAIISHTEHYRLPDGTIVGWGPTISEINHLAKDFEEIYHIAFLYTKAPSESSLPYTSQKINFIPLKPVGGKGFSSKLELIYNIPTILSTVRKTLKLVDVFQLRTPTGIGVFLIPYLTFFSAKKGWYKYAGNWIQKNPPLGYALQRWFLKQQKRKVTINGRWPNQPEQCLTFENPCLTEAEREEGLQITNLKKIEPPFTFCFVGRLEDTKGVQRIIDAFRDLDSLDKVDSIHFIGDGEKMDHYKSQCNTFGLPALFHGFLERVQVFEIYKKAHFILLPSDSEGFPKVIAEAMNYGCIPLVSDISCVSQYIVDNINGFLIKPISKEGVEIAIVKSMKDFNYKDIIEKNYNIAEHFTFDFYKKTLKNQIINY